MRGTGVIDTLRWTCAADMRAWHMVSCTGSGDLFELRFAQSQPSEGNKHMVYEFNAYMN